ncbi:sulfur carrier protein ThiS [Pedobacter sp. AW1-32]|uniref:sulfur carrier protein ThiS n=1 Tax=Pedobacter sp. AW1-32 TaxID=3383026 RepID=UPI003FEF1DE8
MEITFNHKKRQLSGQISIENLLSMQFGEIPRGIAVAINRVILQKSQWPNQMLCNGDEILVIRATQGG